MVPNMIPLEGKRSYVTRLAGKKVIFTSFSFCFGGSARSAETPSVTLEQLINRVLTKSLNTFSFAILSFRFVFQA